ncbi:hypothetical protein EVC13_021 [Rhizobium phage RHph_I65]|nr:hypothetical protein EVC13_021 [Rhizobium phage RHph_I65]
MNNERRKALKAVRHQLEALHAALSAFDIDTIHSELEEIRDREREVFDAMPESLQNSDRGQVSSDALDQLDGALEELEELKEFAQKLENAVGAIETAEA